MLDKNKLILKLNEFVPKYFFNINQEVELARQYFDWLREHQHQIRLILSQEAKYTMPDYINNIDQVKDLNLDNKFLLYTVISVDGSQIYPDRHYGISCFLLNLGLVQINYLDPVSQVNFSSVPYLYKEIQNTEHLSQEIINCKRNELEIQKCLELSINAKNYSKNIIALLDGTLIFSHLDSKDIKIRDYFLSRYIKVLDEFYQKRIPVFGFISFTKSKDIVNIIKNGILLSIIPDLSYDYLHSSLDNNLTEKNLLDNVVDSDLMDHILKPFCRSNIFLSNTKILNYYPDHLKINFCYINIESEIIRVEFPSWLSQDLEYLDSLLKLIIDQCKKGQGYPVALSEAHEQAVVKSIDREFFFQMIQKISLTNKNSLKMSKKSLKKKFVSI